MMFLRLRNTFCFVLVVIGLSLLWYTWPTVVNKIVLSLNFFLPSLTKDWCWWSNVLNFTKFYGFDVHHPYFMVLFRVRVAVDSAMFCYGLQLILFGVLLFSFRKVHFYYVSYVLVALLLAEYAFLFFHIISFYTYDASRFLLGRISYVMYCFSPLLFYGTLFLILQSRLSAFWKVILILLEIFINGGIIYNIVYRIQDFSVFNACTVSFDIQDNKLLAWVDQQIFASYGFAICMNDPCLLIKIQKVGYCESAKALKNVKVTGEAKVKVCSGIVKMAVVQKFESLCNDKTREFFECYEKYSKKK